ncbi:MAG: thymidylate synthase [archaeon GW2011_AR3]|nr:MAG: thymidylate synthase [archaeon GW2011_AR3]MBS3109453.1 thymidylate synthase [Candidatus Woesearchaeota archaeon]
MKQYLDALKQVLEHGTDRKDRTGVGTRAIFGMQLRFRMEDGFPAMTTKKLAWNSVVSELLWFIEGSNDERRLAEILYGTRDNSKKTIWTANGEANYWKPKAGFEGDLGRVYGVQWRRWKSPSGKEIDQLSEAIRMIKENPTSRRIIVNAWNPGELDMMALPPCHAFFQFFVAGGRLSLQMYQRSCDMFLGVPFNIASYSLLLHMVAQSTGLKAGDFVHVLGDAHIYHNHFEQVREQLARTPFPLPGLWLNPEIRDIYKFAMKDIRLDNYQSHPSIKAPMAV